MSQGIAEEEAEPVRCAVICAPMPTAVMDRPMLIEQAKPPAPSKPARMLRVGLRRLGVRW